jgi:diguanylate cyclase (GGDEF)-like protein
LNVNLGGVVPDKNEQLIGLFTKYGLTTFTESTRTLIVLLSEGGKLLSWNHAFDAIKQELHDATHLRDFLSLSSRTLFDLLLSSVTHDRIKTQGELDLGQGNHHSGYSCHLHPIPDGQVLFVAEPSHADTDLESITVELQRTKQYLERKETELHAVLSQAHEVSTTDSLTSLPNRRQIMAELQDAVSFADRYGTLVSILLLDIDYFKKINDTHGHVVGDEVLRSLAGKLRQMVSAPESIGRYGGEEFVFILPHTTAKSASEYAARLCDQVRSLAIPVADQILSITVSIGIAQYKIQQEDWQAFLSRADNALGRAKDQGRDQWVVSEE